MQGSGFGMSAALHGAGLFLRRVLIGFAVAAVVTSSACCCGAGVALWGWL